MISIVELMIESGFFKNLESFRLHFTKNSSHEFHLELNECLSLILRDFPNLRELTLPLHDFITTYID